MSQDLTNQIRLGSCACVFKDDTCRYAGEETSCDHTLRRCQELGNDANYRGDRLPLPSED